MKKISRRSFLGKLIALAVVPFLPISIVVKQREKKKPVISTNGRIEIKNGSDIILIGDLVAWNDNKVYPMSDIKTQVALGVARRNIKEGETIEYSPSGNTKDLLTVGSVDLS